MCVVLNYKGCFCLPGFPATFQSLLARHLRTNKALKALSHTCNLLRPTPTQEVFKPLMTAIAAAALPVVSSHKGFKNRLCRSRRKCVNQPLLDVVRTYTRCKKRSEICHTRIVCLDCPSLQCGATRHRRCSRWGVSTNADAGRRRNGVRSFVRCLAPNLRGPLFMAARFGLRSTMPRRVVGGSGVEDAVPLPCPPSD